MKRLILATVAALALLALGACSGGSGKKGLGTAKPSSTSSTSSESPTSSESSTSAGEQAYVDALVNEFASEASSDSTVPNGSQARCIAKRWIRVMGVERLQQHGLTPSKLAGLSDISALGLTHGDGVALIDGLQSCGYDWRQLVWNEARSSGKLTTDQIDCLKKHVDANTLKSAFADGLVGRNQEAAAKAIQDEVKNAAGTCKIATSDFGGS